MPNGTSRDGTSEDSASLSFGEGVNDITNLLTGLDDDVLNPGEDDDPAEQGSDEADDSEAPDEDQLQLDDEVDPDAEPADGTDEAPARGGSFVPDTGKVTMPDGRVLSVADLKRDHLYQSDYTRKTTEFRAEVEQFNKDREFVGQHAERVAKERAVLAEYLQKYVPQPPSPELARTDPYQYGIQRAEFEEKQGVLASLYQANEEAQTQALQNYQAELEQIKQQEAVKLFEAKPHLRDQVKFTQWYNEVAQVMVEKYKFTPQEVNEATDHRFYLMMDDLKRLHTALAKATGKPVQGQQRVQGKPKLLAGSNRNAPVSGSNRQRQVLTERHQKLGTMESGVAKLRMFKDL